MKLSDLKHSIDEETPCTQFIGGFPKEHISVIASAPGTGKTWFVLKNAMDVSTGNVPFCGIGQPHAPAKALIMSGEGGLNMLIERARLLKNARNKDLISIYTIQDMAQQEIEISLDSHNGTDNLRKIIIGERAEIVYIDSLIAFIDNDENAQKDTARMLKKLLMLAQKTHTAIVITHHTRKKKRGDNGKVTQDDIIGSSAITRLCAMAWTMTREDDQEYTKLTCVKTWFEQPQSIYWKLQKHADGQISIKRAITGTLTEQISAAKKYIISKGEGTIITIQEIEDNAFVDNQAAYLAMQAIAQTEYGTIIRNENGVVQIKV